MVSLRCHLRTDAEGRERRRGGRRRRLRVHLLRRTGLERRPDAVGQGRPSRDAQRRLHLRLLDRARRDLAGQPREGVHRHARSDRVPGAVEHQLRRAQLWRPGLGGGVTGGSPAVVSRRECHRRLGDDQRQLRRRPGDDADDGMDVWHGFGHDQLRRQRDRRQPCLLDPGHHDLGRQRLRGPAQSMELARGRAQHAAGQLPGPHPPRRRSVRAAYGHVLPSTTSRSGARRPQRPRAARGTPQVSDRRWPATRSAPSLCVGRPDPSSGPARGRRSSG
jgi:hypothetical protein